MKLELNDQELTLVGKALTAMPYGEVAMLISELQKQINENKSDNTVTQGQGVNDS